MSATKSVDFCGKGIFSGWNIGSQRNCAELTINKKMRECGFLDNNGIVGGESGFCGRYVRGFVAVGCDPTGSELYG